MNLVVLPAYFLDYGIFCIGEFLAVSPGFSNIPRASGVARFVT